MSKRYFQDPKFNEWLVYRLENLEVEQTSSLNSHEKALVATKEARKRFATSAPLDKVLSFLTKIGLHTALVICDTGKLDPEIFKRAFIQHHSKNQHTRNAHMDVLAEMKEKNLFVVDERQIAIALSMMADDCHSAAFELNEQFPKGKRSLNRLKEAIKSKSIEHQFKEHTEAFQNISRLLFESVLIKGWLSGRKNVTLVDLMILLVLVLYPTNYVAIGKIQRSTASVRTGATITKRCNYMWLHTGLLEKLPKQRPPAYRITSKGILLIGEVLNHIVRKLD